MARFPARAAIVSAGETMSASMEAGEAEIVLESWARRAAKGFMKRRVVLEVVWRPSASRPWMLLRDSIGCEEELFSFCSGSFVPEILDAWSVSWLFFLSLKIADATETTTIPDKQSRPEKSIPKNKKQAS